MEETPVTPSSAESPVASVDGPGGFGVPLWGPGEGLDILQRGMNEHTLNAEEVVDVLGGLESGGPGDSGRVVAEAGPPTLNDTEIDLGPASAPITPDVPSPSPPHLGHTTANSAASPSTLIAPLAPQPTIAVVPPPSTGKPQSSSSIDLLSFNSPASTAPTLHLHPALAAAPTDPLTQSSASLIDMSTPVVAGLPAVNLPATAQSPGVQQLDRSSPPLGLHRPAQATTIFDPLTGIAESTKPLPPPPSTTPLPPTNPPLSLHQSSFLPTRADLQLAPQPVPSPALSDASSSSNSNSLPGPTPSIAPRPTIPPRAESLSYPVNSNPLSAQSSTSLPDSLSSRANVPPTKPAAKTESGVVMVGWVDPGVMGEVQIPNPLLFPPTPDSDPLQSLIASLTHQPATRRPPPSTNPPNINTLAQLLSKRYFHAAVNLTRQLITTSDPSDLPTLTTLWLARITALHRLSHFPTAKAELSALDLDGPTLRIENRPTGIMRRVGDALDAPRADSRGSVAPWELRVAKWRCEGEVVGKEVCVNGVWAMAREAAAEARRWNEEMAKAARGEPASDPDPDACAAYARIWKGREQECRLVAATALAELGDCDAAGEVVGSIAREHVEDVGVALAVGRLLLMCGDVSGAGKIFHMAVGTAGGDPAIRETCDAMLAIARGDFSAALDHFAARCALPEHPCATIASARNNGAVCALYGGDLRGATEAAESLVEEDDGAAGCEAVAFNLATMYELCEGGVERKGGVVVNRIGSTAGVLEDVQELLHAAEEVTEFVAVLKEVHDGLVVADEVSELVEVADDVLFEANGVWELLLHVWKLEPVLEDVEEVLVVAEEVSDLEEVVEGVWELVTVLDVVKEVLFVADEEVQEVLVVPEEVSDLVTVLEEVQVGPVVADEVSELEEVVDSVWELVTVLDVLNEVLFVADKEVQEVLVVVDDASGLVTVLREVQVGLVAADEVFELLVVEVWELVPVLEEVQELLIVVEDASGLVTVLEEVQVGLVAADEVFELVAVVDGVWELVTVLDVVKEVLFMADEEVSELVTVLEEVQVGLVVADEVSELVAVVDGVWELVTILDVVKEASFVADEV
ncbi:hypothetical protein HDU93_002882 [Gonapodya sp. JEL0774]|nr:hypothetical protein HDU93_002882 [Gonapodya sp. JEL0774]